MRPKSGLTSRGEPIEGYVFQEYPKWLYHPTIAPAGRIFQTAEETKGLRRKGWVDSPGKFPGPSRLESLHSWWTKRSWVFAAMALILGIIWTAIQILNLEERSDPTSKETSSVAAAISPSSAFLEPGSNIV